MSACGVWLLLLTVLVFLTSSVSRMPLKFYWLVKSKILGMTNLSFHTPPCFWIFLCIAQSVGACLGWGEVRATAG